MDLLLYKKESGKTLKTQKYKPKNQPTLLSTPRKSQTPFWGQSGGWLESQASLAENSLYTGGKVIARALASVV